MNNQETVLVVKLTSSLSIQDIYDLLDAIELFKGVRGVVVRSESQILDDKANRVSGAGDLRKRSEGNDYTRTR